MKKLKVGEIPKSRIPVIDDQGRVRGRVGPKATSVTVSRFLGKHGAELKKHDGRLSWVGPSAPVQRKPETANHKSARGSVRAKS